MSIMDKLTAEERILLLNHKMWYDLDNKIISEASKVLKAIAYGSIPAHSAGAYAFAVLQKIHKMRMEMTSKLIPTLDQL